MDEWVEIEGKSRADAIERACDALNTTGSYLRYVILSEGPGGTKIRASKSDRQGAPERSEAPERHVEGRRQGRVEEESDDDPAPVRKERAQPVAVEATETGTKAREMLVKIVSNIEEGAKVELTETEDTIFLDMQGGEAGRFIGKHGQTLDALQHILMKMLGLDRETSKHLVVDSEKYRVRREESLEDLARKLADKARRERRSVSARPMNSMDRRILHLALKNERDVTTKSIGEGDERKVLVVPNRVSGPGRGEGRRRGFPRREAPSENRRPPTPRQERYFAPMMRQHDSFDVPPDPAVEHLPEEPDAPIMTRGVAETDATLHSPADEKPETVE